MFEAVAIGDLHFDHLRKYWGDEDVNLQLAEIRKPLRYARKHGIPHVVFLGDVSEHGHMPDRYLLPFLDLLREFDDLRIHIIPGNHDVISSEQTALVSANYLQERGFMDHVKVHLHPHSERIDGVWVSFLPWPHDKPAVKERKAFKHPPHLCFAHIDRPGALRDNGSRIKIDGDIEDAKDAWVIGHIHTSQKVRRNWYPGTLYQCNFGESLPKGFAHVKARTINYKLQIKCELVRNHPAFTLVNLRVANDTDLKELTHDDRIRYKLHVQKGYRLPSNLLQDYPNIHTVTGAKESSDGRVEETIAQAHGDDEVSVDLTYGLQEFLAGKGATEKQQRIAMKEVHDTIERGIQ